MKMNTFDQSFATTQLVDINISDDVQYLQLTERKSINLKCIDMLAHEDECACHAFRICTIFARFLDHTRQLELIEALRELLITSVIELKTNERGEHVINVLRNRGQAALLRVLLTHFTLQKRLELSESGPFNNLKHLLLKNMRHQGAPISVNSLSVTLSRVVRTYCTTD